MMYALMVEDVRADASIRHRLDDILAGVITPESVEPDWSKIDKPSDEQMEKLRATWGMGQQAQEGKAAMDEMLKGTR